MRLDQSERDLPGLLEMVRQIRLATPGGSEGLGSAVGAQPDAMPETDETGRPIAMPGQSVVREVPPGEWQPELEMDDPTRRRPMQIPADPASIRARQFPGKPVAQPATAPQAAPPKAQASDPDGDGVEGMDVQRALMGLVHGVEGIRAVDSSRAQKAQTKLAQQKQAQEMELGQFTLDEQKKRAAMMQAAADPNSAVSAGMRDEVATGLGIRAQMHPELKPLLDGMAQHLQGMSATDMMSMQGRLKDLFDDARAMAHNRATEEMARAKLDQGERQIQATAEDKKQGRAIQWQQLHQQAEHLRQQDADRKERLGALPEGELKRYREIGNAEAEVQKLRELLPKIRYTGWGAQALNSGFQKMPSFADLRTPEEREFVTLIGRLRAPERKDLFGAALSKFDISDSDGFMASLGTNAETIDSNLSTLADGLTLESAYIEARYPGAQGTKAKAQQLIAEKKGKKPGETKPPAGAPSGKPKTVIQNGYTYTLQPDGSYK